MEKEIDVLIIGGGLAGLTCAIHLMKCGIQVTVADSAHFPKHKVCGEYISNEVVSYLKWLGVDPGPLKPSKISKLCFSTASGKVIQTDLPLGGFGVSRYLLDNYLYEKARQLGCKFIHENVESIDFTEDQFIGMLSGTDTFRSRIVIGAFGKRSSVDHALRRKFITKKSPWLAVKGHYRGQFEANHVGLHNFRGGYCGVSKVEDGIINICYLADFKSFKKYKNISEYEQSVLHRNPVLKQIFENVKPVFDKPLTISQISFDTKKCIENHVLMIGDTAGLIHPLCGNGMAMAIHSAKIAAQHVAKYLSNPEMSRQTLEKEYAESWKSHFRSRLRTGRLLAKMMEMQELSDLAIGVIGFFPSILQKIIRHTHGNEIAIPL